MKIQIKIHTIRVCKFIFVDFEGLLAELQT